MPVTIGPFTDVPAPNDPVASAWAQEITQFAVDDITIGSVQPTNPNAELWYDTADNGQSYGTQPRGLVGIRQATASAYANATAVYTDITASTGQAPLINAALDPTRWYRATLLTFARSTTVANVRIGFALFAGATQLIEGLYLTGAANGTSSMVVVFMFKPVVATAVDYKMAARTDGAVTTINVNPSATSPMQFTIEDVGM